MAPQGDNKLAKIGEVFSHVNKYYTARYQTHRTGMSTVGTVNLPAATETAQHYRSDGQPAAVAREKKQLVEINSEEAAQKFGGLAIAERGVGRSSSGLGFPLGPGPRKIIGFNLNI